MLASALLWSGLMVALVGAVTLLRPLRRLRIPTRARAAGVLAGGVLLALVAALLPAPLSRVARPASRLDALLPAWQFAERHQTRIHADGGRVERAVRAVTAGEIRLFRLLTWLRNPRRAWRPQPASLLAAPADRPILEVALGSGFKVLAEEPGRELVLGTLVVLPPELAALPAGRRRDWWQQLTPAGFRDLAAPGCAKAVMSFQLHDDGAGWTRLVTETRVYATDDGARRRFAPYWRAIYPGSALIRRTWLRAIRQRAERESGPPAAATAPPPPPASGPPARTP
jgi:hypothetical protein